MAVGILAVNLRKTIKLLGVAGVGVLVAGAPHFLDALRPAYAQSTQREYQLKAAFVYNFIKFVDWPGAVLPETSDTISVCVLGEEAFAEGFDTLKDKTVKGKKLAVRRLEQVKDADGCHVLFISSSADKRAPQVLQTLQSASVLTVGEMDRFPQLGGIINFVVERNKLRFEINVSSAERARLKLSSQLLSLAKVVRQ
jgi:hypothetical protein